jgi:hypothetical protein
MTVQEMQKKVSGAGFRHFRVIDKDHVVTIVDEEETLFSRSDKYSGHPMSGLAYFGTIYGDHRMIQQIAEDVEQVFSLI